MSYLTFIYKFPLFYEFYIKNNCRIRPTKCEIRVTEVRVSELLLYFVSSSYHQEHTIYMSWVIYNNLDR